MDLLSLIPDNISEVLVKIIQFTELRRRILHRNIQDMGVSGYVPQDVPVLEFAELLNVALAEHLQHRRLLFRDTANITFAGGGGMRVRPVADDYARSLLDTEPDEFLELQISRLLENSLNRRVAEELLRQTGGAAGNLPRLDIDAALVGDTLPEDRSLRRDRME